MAGGEWSEQNKVLPGVYISYKSAPSSLITKGDRGVVAYASLYSWGPSETFIEVEDPSQSLALLGYDQTANQLEFMRQMFLGSNRTRGAKKILFWRLASTDAVKAAVTSGSLTVTATYTGTRGNDLTVVITADPDNSSTNGYTYVIQTLLGGSVVDTQTITKTTQPTIADLKNNAWVVFSGTGNLSANTGLVLANGTNGTTAATAHSNFMSALESKRFDVVCYDGTDAVLKAAYASFVERMNRDEGIKCQAVVSNYSASDTEFVINAKSQALELITGATLTAEQFTWWIAGASAGADINESLTNAIYPNIAKVTPELSKTEQIESIEKGQFAIVNSFDEFRVLDDVNSLHSFTVEKGKLFSQNRVSRSLNNFINDVQLTFSKHYVGAVDNEEEGRKLLKANILALMLQYQSKKAFQNVNADDVEIFEGDEKTAVVIAVAIQFVGSINKIYIKVTCS